MSYHLIGIRNQPYIQNISLVPVLCYFGEGERDPYKNKNPGWCAGICCYVITVSNSRIFSLAAGRYQTG